MLECANCGATGEANFSTNYFGELVCELCGTQSFQQSRNETQDVDDMAMDVTRVSRTLKRASRRRKRGPDVAAAANKSKRRKARRLTTDVELLDCLVATQNVLEHQVRALMTRVGGFPPEYPRVVRDLWFQLLECWESKSGRPFLRCYTEYFIRQAVVKGEEGDGLDHAMTQDLLAQWDAERQQTDNEVANEGEDAEEGVTYGGQGVEKREVPPNYSIINGKMTVTNIQRARIERTRTLRRIGIVDLLPLMWLAARVLNLPLLPCDFTNWVLTGEIPYSNLLETCCEPELRARIADVSMFFETSILRNKVTTAKIIYNAHCLQHHMELRLPPLNASLVAYSIVENLGLPPLVFRNFQWITALMNAKGDLPEPPLITVAPGIPGRFIPHDLTPRLLDTGVGIAAHLIVAVKMCPNWFTWIFERVARPQENADSSGESTSQGKKERLDRANLEPHARKVPSLPRRHLEAFIAFCEQALVDPERQPVPDAFAKHAMKLQTLEPSARDTARDGRRQPDGPTESLRTHELRTYPPLYEGGVCVETDDEIEAHLAKLRAAQSQLRQGDGSMSSGNADEDNRKSGEASDGEEEALQDSEDGSDGVEAYFYPVYDGRENMKYAMHPVYENVVEMLCEYVDAPMSAVVRIVTELDMRLEALCTNFGKRGYRKRTTTQAATSDPIQSE